MVKIESAEEYADLDPPQTQTLNHPIPQLNL